MKIYWKNKISQIKRAFDVIYLVDTSKKRTDSFKKSRSTQISLKSKNGEAVVYGDAIFGSNFKLLFKSMVSNQQNLN